MKIEMRYYQLRFLVPATTTSENGTYDIRLIYQGLRGKTD